MTKQLAWTTVALVLAVGITACGGSSSTAPTPAPTPTPPTRAEVTFNVDPNPIVANHAGNDWYRFKVNLAFSESAGIGYTVDTIRARMRVTSTGEVVSNELWTIDMRVSARGREVIQLTSGLYRAAGGGRIGLGVEFTARITDDRGNSLVASNEVTISHRGGPRVELPQ